MLTRRWGSQSNLYGLENDFCVKKNVSQVINIIVQRMVIRQGSRFNVNPCITGRTP